MNIVMYALYACTKKVPHKPHMHFRACKISKFPGGVFPDPSHTIYIMGPTFCWAPPILSVAVRVSTVYGEDLTKVTSKVRLKSVNELRSVGHSLYFDNIAVWIKNI